MTITLLLDLDDTLLDTNLINFAPAYFSALAKALAPAVSPDVMLPALLGGTDAMKRNMDPAMTLQQVFDDHFFSRLGVPRIELQAKIDAFYETEFPTLQPLTSKRPAAKKFVDWAVAAGHSVAIATNPFFPRRAVEHRLSWAGLPVEQYPFGLVSSYENFHFTKENIAYFPEFLGKLGWPEGPVVMVGNDPEMDLLPARKAGLSTFWLEDGKNAKDRGIPGGNFDDLQSWLKTTRLEELQPGWTSPESVLAILRSTPAVIQSRVANMPVLKWQESPAPGEWCLTEILCHLRDVEREVNLPRIEKILHDDNPFLAGAVTDEWVEGRGYKNENGAEAFMTFMEARKRSIAILENLQEAWQRPARHAIFGPTSLLELTRFTAEHDRAHIQQIWKTLLT